MFCGQRGRLVLLSVFGALLVSASPAAGQTGAPLPPGCDRLVEFDPAEFGSSTVIDNQFLPSLREPSSCWRGGRIAPVSSCPTP